VADDRPLRRFDTVRELLAAARRTTSGGAVTRATGLSVQAGLLLTEQEADLVRRRRGIAATMRRIVDNAGKRGVDRIRKVSRPTYDTGLFYSAWRAERTDDSGTGLRLDLAFLNPAPYAIWVHRRGTSKQQTVVNTYVRPIVDQVANELVEDLVKPVDSLRDAVREEVLAGLL